LSQCSGSQEKRETNVSILVRLVALLIEQFAIKFFASVEQFLHEPIEAAWPFILTVKPKT
jgi:hypothetical protein